MTEDKKGLQQKKETQEAGNSTEIHCEINGKPVSIKKGSSIIEAFYPSYKDIAHYCWHPGLSVAGVCRLCMVEIQGQDRLQVACNTKVQEGMVISNQSDKVKNAVRWGMDFHLINHPLDCPICDQSGECGLQELYMRFGKYDPDMAERKVKKRKVVNLGEKIVLDTERCILCTRCVRFTEEVSKTHELGIFHRGDRSEIGVFKDKPLNNNYSLNTVDICPVGALTAKDFRFRQRVWYLKSAPSLCPGCSTGCNVRVFYNEEGLFRIQPVYNKDVNGHWMCDEGRKSYQFVNLKYRLTKAKRKKGKDSWKEESSVLGAIASIKKTLLSKEEKRGQQIALVLTGQYTNEEYEGMLNWFSSLGSEELYHWQQEKRPVHLWGQGKKPVYAAQEIESKKDKASQSDDFDGILFRSDRNPNTKGLKKILKKFSSLQLKDWAVLEKKLKKGKIESLFVAGPENFSLFLDIEEKVKLFSQAQNVIWLTACVSKFVDELEAKNQSWQIPLKTYFEKDGSFVNYRGLEQKIKRGATIVSEAFTLEEVGLCLQGKEEELIKRKRGSRESYLKTNHFCTKKQALF